MTRKGLGLEIMIEGKIDKVIIKVTDQGQSEGHCDDAGRCGQTWFSRVSVSGGHESDERESHVRVD